MTDETQLIQEFVKDCSLEVTPGGARKIEDMGAIFDENQRVYVTFLPGSPYHEMIETVERVVNEAGAKPVPHLAARSIASSRMLEDILARLAELEIKEALLIGGGVNIPLGPYESSMDILQEGLFEKYNFTDIGFAGHPEGSPDISNEVIIDYLRQKNDYAKDSPIRFRLVTQFTFDAKPIIAWDKHIQKVAGNKLPIHIGLPGLATIKTLLKHAQACGVGPSMTILTKQARNIAKLLVVNAPDGQVRELAAYRANDPECGIEGVHLFPLGGLNKSLHWLNQVRAGQFTLNKKGGFQVHESL